MTKKQILTLSITTSTSFATSFSGSAMNLAIPSLSSYFHMGAASVGWITTAYMLVIAAVSVPFGKIADNTSRRNMLIGGVAVFGAASVAGTFAWSAATILFIRAVQGIGAAMLFASNVPIAVSAFPPQQRGKAIGIVSTGVYFGLAIGPALGGFLNNTFSWKAIFYFGAFIAFSSMILAIIFLDKDRVDNKGAKLDLGGNVVYMFMLACIIYGLTGLNSVRFSWAVLVFGILLGVLFTYIELKSEDPVIDVRIFANDRVFTLSNLTALLNYSATFSLGYFVSIYLQVAQGLNSSEAGLIMITQPIVMALLSARTGNLSDKVPAYKLASAGMGVCAAALLFFVFAQVNTPIVVVIMALIVAGIGIALFSAPNTNVVMGCVPPSQYAVANAVLSTMRTTGQTTGMAIITIVVSATIGNVSLYDVPPADLVSTMHIAFIIFTILCIAGMFMSLARRKTQAA